MPPKTAARFVPGGKCLEIDATYSATRGSAGLTACDDIGSVTSRKTATLTTISAIVIQWMPRGLG